VNPCDAEPVPTGKTEVEVRGSWRATHDAEELTPMLPFRQGETALWFIMPMQDSPELRELREQWSHPMPGLASWWQEMSTRLEQLPLAGEPLDVRLALSLDRALAAIQIGDLVRAKAAISMVRDAIAEAPLAHAIEPIRGAVELARPVLEGLDAGTWSLADPCGQRP
jgi:hypothetical protein